jgi:hypothetical protein
MTTPTDDSLSTCPVCHAPPADRMPSGYVGWPCRCPPPPPVRAPSRDALARKLHQQFVTAMRGADADVLDAWRAVAELARAELAVEAKGVLVSCADIADRLRADWNAAARSPGLDPEDELGERIARLKADVIHLDRVRALSRRRTRDVVRAAVAWDAAISEGFFPAERAAEKDLRAAVTHYAETFPKPFAVEVRQVEPPPVATPAARSDRFDVRAESYVAGHGVSLAASAAIDGPTGVALLVEVFDAADAAQAAIVGCAATRRLQNALAMARPVRDAAAR